MNKEVSHKLLHVKIKKDQYDRLLDTTRAFLTDELDVEVSYFNARKIADFFIHELGPTIYNQAIQDAHQFAQHALMDLESTLYEPETPHDP